ncbi:hypothetical protein B0T16DRAFT_492030 [Cercophora newfieldiana]|uniref:Carbohydrate-binding module family 19 domain-containing protein n=1 Tax=Cercophora newfieldiana TaxID=92897 RepID=A0AA39YDA9_9PEZI|nr:hypothetical protein B0T16DRAFT_492030 [Cercophora newfieldiana]
MRTSISLTLFALLFAAAEAGPLINNPDRREAAVKKWAREEAAKAPDSGNSGSGASDTFSTVVTFVPGEALKGSATGAASAPPAVSSFLSDGSTLPGTTAAATTTADAAKPTEDAAQPPVASANPKIPTAVTSKPPATGTVSPDVFQINLDAAKQFNADFATLTKDTPCVSNQAACIDGKTALCAPTGAFLLTACPAGTSCFALPLDTAEGVQLKCVDQATAEKVLGAPPPPPAPTVSVPGEFTKTATVSETSGAVTITMTVRPDLPASSAPKPPTTTAVEVIPIEDPPPQPSPPPSSPHPPTPRAPEPTSTRDGEEPERPKPTQGPEAGNGNGQKGPNEDTRVTFTLIETTTVTEKETVTVTAAGATITARVAVRM